LTLSTSWCGIYGNTNIAPCTGPSPSTTATLVLGRVLGNVTWKASVQFTTPAQIKQLPQNQLAIGFEFRFGDGKKTPYSYLNATILSISSKNLVAVQVVAKSDLGRPNLVRYAWRDRPCAPFFNPAGGNCQLYYSDGLPLYPFFLALS